MRIATCTEADLVPLELHLPTGRNKAHAHHYTRQASGAAEYLVAWADDVPVGYGLINWAGFRDEPPRAAHPACPEISNLGVTEAWRGKGIGTALLTAAEARILARGFQQAGLGVDEGNPDAARLYERLGYRDTTLRSEMQYTYYDRDDVPHDMTETVRFLVKDLP